MTPATPVRDITEEARRLVLIAREQDVPLRLLGGLAVRFLVGDSPGSLTRTYKDIDFATVKRGGKAVRELLSDSGYAPDEEFNALNGHRRLLFFDDVNGRQVDVFVGSFAMCHTIPLAERLCVRPDTIPTAELLLTKLQIVELNDKDLLDIVALFHEHRVGDDDAPGVLNAPVIAGLAADDWGLWRTLQLNLERLEEHVPQLLPPEAANTVVGRARDLWKRIEDEPKPRRWKLRARVGDHKRWYEAPDEVA